MAEQGETKSAGDEKAANRPVDDLKTTRHELTVDGQTLKYTATTG